AASVAQAASAARAIARRARTVDMQDSFRGGRRPAVVLGPPNRPGLGDPNKNARAMPTPAIGKRLHAATPAEALGFARAPSGSSSRMASTAGPVPLTS